MIFRADRTLPSGLRARALGEGQPRQARRFAEATGRLAKTDRLDAALLARMGALLDLEARPPRSEALAELKDLHLARGALVKDRTAARNRAKSRALPILRRQSADRLKQIRRQIADLDAEILRRIRADRRGPGASTSSSASRAWQGSLPSLCLSTCPSLANSMPERPALSQALLRSRVNPDAGPAVPSFAAAGQRPERPLHAGSRRGSLQPRPQGLLRPSPNRRETRKGRTHRHHRKLLVLASAPPRGSNLSPEKP